MRQIKNYLGLEAQNPQPEEHAFSLPLVYSAVVFVLFIWLIVMQWPEAGIPSPLHRYNPELDGGINWVEDSPLGQGTRVLAWAAFAWKFSMYLVVTALLYRLARIFYTKAHFGTQALALLRAAQIVLLGGMIVYSLLTAFLTRAVANDYDLPDIHSESTFFSDQGLLTLLFVATLFFIEGALRRGLTLQEDSDATI
ncbi:hypothetical protein ACN08Y_02645 [Rothia sp. P5764]|uniref:hypothetical protein n=1 Tax=Rothia sp. P5764 TaxID=3402654 RepID=UPI003ABF2EF8